MDIFVFLGRLKMLLLRYSCRINLSSIRSPCLPSISSVIPIPHGRSTAVGASAALSVTRFIDVSGRMWSWVMHLLLRVHLHWRIRLGLLHVGRIRRRLVRYCSWWWRRWWWIIRLSDHTRYIRLSLRDQKRLSKTVNPANKMKWTLEWLWNYKIFVNTCLLTPFLVEACTEIECLLASHPIVCGYLGQVVMSYACWMHLPNQITWRVVPTTKRTRAQRTKSNPIQQHYHWCVAPAHYESGLSQPWFQGLSRLGILAYNSKCPPDVPTGQEDMWVMNSTVNRHPSNYIAITENAKQKWLK